MSTIERGWDVIRAGTAARVAIVSGTLAASMIGGVWWYNRGGSAPDPQYRPQEELVVDGAIFERMLIVHEPDVDYEGNALSEFDLQYDARGAPFAPFATTLAITNAGGSVSTNHVWSYLGAVPRDLAPPPYSLWRTSVGGEGRPWFWRLSEYNRAGKLRELLSLSRWREESETTGEEAWENYPDPYVLYPAAFPAAFKVFTRTNSVEGLVATNPAAWLPSVIYDAAHWTNAVYDSISTIGSARLRILGLVIYGRGGAGDIYAWGRPSVHSNLADDTWADWDLSGEVRVESGALVFGPATNSGDRADWDGPLSNGLYRARVEYERDSLLAPPPQLYTFTALDSEYTVQYTAGPVNLSWARKLRLRRTPWHSADLSGLDTPYVPVYIVPGQTNAARAIRVSSSLEDYREILTGMDTSARIPEGITRGWAKTEISATGTNYAQAREGALNRMLLDVVDGTTNVWTETAGGEGNAISYTVETYPVRLDTPLLIGGVYDSVDYGWDGWVVVGGGDFDGSLYVGPFDQESVGHTGTVASLHSVDVAASPSEGIGGAGQSYTGTTASVSFDGGEVGRDYEVDSIVVYGWDPNPRWEITLSPELNDFSARMIYQAEPESTSARVYIAGRNWLDLSYEGTAPPGLEWPDTPPVRDPYGWTGTEIRTNAAAPVLGADYIFAQVGETLVASNATTHTLGGGLVVDAYKTGYNGWGANRSDQEWLESLIGEEAPCESGYPDSYSLSIEYGYAPYRSGAAATGGALDSFAEVAPLLLLGLSEYDPEYLPRGDAP